MFQPVPAPFDFPSAEEQVLAFWDKHDVFAGADRRRDGSPSFVLYEGPPTANGTPHPGHVLTRVMKDLFPRHRTMTGHRCLRKGGWDTHGLPVEIEVEKELGIDGKEQIEAYGVEPFNRRCMESVLKYKADWEKMSRRLGFWIHMEEAYATFTSQYVQSVWWALSEIHRKGLLYQGHKSVPWCPRCETALSSHELGLGYKEIDDLSIYVGFRTINDPKTLLLAWTTTPWTLPSNAALAVNVDFDYAYLQVGEERLVVADSLVDEVMGDVPYEKTAVVKGQELLDIEYEPLFDFATFNEKAHYVIAADFVTLDSGAGIVHVAPGFGADDYRVGSEHGLPVIQLVTTSGHMTSECGEMAGKWIKDADKLVVSDLKKRGLFFRQQNYRHDYPFCWRCDSPLIYYARKSWFIRTTDRIDRIIENNKKINWLPGHIRDGRFGNFLESNVDWALSRERFWGTPLPVWVCAGCEKQTAVASRAEILERNPAAFDRFAEARAKDPSISEHMELHRPYIDDVTIPCENCGETMRRAPEVIDCWFDAGCMPFAQWGFPHTGKDEFGANFPADFICEAIDQTRGWFYSLLTVSTLLFEDQPLPHPFRNCIVLGLVHGKDGKKLSKKLRNYDDPDRIFQREGADAMRWYFFSAQPPWTSPRFDESAIAESQREFLIRLYNVYSFFVIYANIDRFNPTDDDATQPSKLDRWILSELNRCIQSVREAMDRLDNHGASRHLIDFVDGLSNWYVRRSRSRYWRAEMDPDKRSAYMTLWTCLTKLSELIAPFTPFLAETMYQNLVMTCRPDADLSVHWRDYPDADAALIDDRLSEEMDLVRRIVQLGRSARDDAGIRVRQPLDLVEIALANDGLAARLADHLDLIADELNVKTVEFTKETDKYVEYKIKPNFRAIGPKFGKLAPAIKNALSSCDASVLRRQIEESGVAAIEVNGQTVELSESDVQVSVAAREGWTAAEGRDAVVILSTTITESLRREGLARELVHQIQNVRKDKDLEYTARIKVAINCAEEFQKVCQDHEEYIMNETLASSFDVNGEFAEGATRLTIEELELNLHVEAVDPK
jgi:isoleucyl-tRNA synthetase